MIPLFVLSTGFDFDGNFFSRVQAKPSSSAASSSISAPQAEKSHTNPINNPNVPANRLWPSSAFRFPKKRIRCSTLAYTQTTHIHATKIAILFVIDKDNEWSNWNEKEKKLFLLRSFYCY